jgi:hypothetical protein
MSSQVSARKPASSSVAGALGLAESIMQPQLLCPSRLYVYGDAPGCWIKSSRRLVPTRVSCDIEGLALLLKALPHHSMSRRSISSCTRTSNAVSRCLFALDYVRAHLREAAVVAEHTNGSMMKSLCARAEDGGGYAIATTPSLAQGFLVLERLTCDCEGCAPRF